jgi:transcription elongation factor Elf1
VSNNRQSDTSEKKSFAVRRKELRKYVNDLKRNGRCAICGETDQACLDFHHTNSKLDNISDLVRKAVSMDVMKAELNKCIIVCANCHRKIHFYTDYEKY